MLQRLINSISVFCLWNFLIFVFLLIFRIIFGQTCYGTTVGDRHASAKAHEAINHLESFPSCREEISQPRIEPPILFLIFRVSLQHHHSVV